MQDAVLRVQTRISRAAPDSTEQSVMARLLVSSNQIGCLLGKGGSIIAEMRKLSRAHIRILGKDQIPKCASEDEEVVQVRFNFDMCFFEFDMVGILFRAIIYSKMLSFFLFLFVGSDIINYIVTFELRTLKS